VASARAGKATKSGVSRGTNAGTPVTSSRPQPRSVQPSELVVQRSVPSGDSPGSLRTSDGRAAGVLGTANAGPFSQRMLRPVATGSRCSTSTATWSTGWSGRTRGTASSTERQRSRSRRSQGASSASTSWPRSARQSLSEVTGTTPYGWRPTRSIGSGPRLRTCSARWSRTARHGRAGSMAWICWVAKSRWDTAASANPLPRVGQVSRDNAATAAGSGSDVPGQAPRNPASGRPSAPASAPAAGRSPAGGSGSGPG
jgi:hypothetical protein